MVFSSWYNSVDMLKTNEYSRLIKESCLDSAWKLASRFPTECEASSEFLAHASHACVKSRLWRLANILALRALSLDPSNKLAKALFAYTEGYDLIARQSKGIESLEPVFSAFGESVIGQVFKRKLLMQVSACRPVRDEEKDILVKEFEKLTTIDGFQDTKDLVVGRLNQLNREHHEWVPQVDAGEVGNEARYANHSDFPNAVLVKRCYSNCGTRMCGLCVKYPHIVALRNIEAGDEITVNYGETYWERTKPGLDPLMFGQPWEHPFEDCVYYNGVVEDFSCTESPGGLLIPPFKTRRNERISLLEVKRVDPEHPAFPGFGLFSKTQFVKNDVICVYGGIADASPFSRRHMSKFTVDSSDHHLVTGPFGFSLEPKSLGLMFTQKYLPFLADFQPLDSKRPDPTSLSEIKEIAGLDSTITKTICDALLLPEFRWAVLMRLKVMKKVTRRNDVEWKRLAKRVFGDIFTKPPPLKRQIDSILN